MDPKRKDKTIIFMEKLGAVSGFLCGAGVAVLLITVLFK